MEEATNNYKEKVMAKFTTAQIAEHAQKIMESFDDGFQWSDFWDIVPQAVAITKDVESMTEEEREETALLLIDYVIDNTDTPWLPDDMIDPILKKGARYMVPRFL